MLYVVAKVVLVPGSREEFLDTIQEFLTASRKEAGCQLYEVTAHHPMPANGSNGVPGPDAPPLDDETVTFIEKWTSLAAYQRHVDSPHTQRCIQVVKEKTMVRKIEIQVLKPAADRAGPRRGATPPR